MIGIHFFGYEAGSGTIAIAKALGVGTSAKRNAAEVGKFDRLQAEAPRRWKAVDANQADVFIMATAYTGGSERMPAVAEAQRLGKPVLFFNAADDVTPLPAHYGVVYRDSMLASRRLPHERTMPAFAKDFFAGDRQFVLRPKQPKPMVGFCGYVSTPLRRTLYRLQFRQQKVLGLALRSRALAALERDPGVATNIVRRSQFWAGAVGRPSPEQDRAQLKVRDEYLQNIVDSDYTLCARGAGNFSYRFYETLSLGRIPLFVNTDCLLPFDDAIDWRKHCVWVEQHELPRIGEILREFHNRLTDDEFAALQRSNRQLWESYLRPLECYEQVLQRALASQHAQTAGHPVDA